jgi:hypothetical protein
MARDEEATRGYGFQKQGFIRINGWCRLCRKSTNRF